MIFLISSPFLSNLLTSFSIGTVKVISISVFSPKTSKLFIICLLTLLKGVNNHKWIRYEKLYEFF